MFSSRRNRSKANRCVAGLEARVVPSAVKVDVVGGVVKITGTPDADSVKISKLDAGGFLVSSDAGSTFSLNGAAAAPTVNIPAVRLVSLDVDLGAASDAFVGEKLDASVVHVLDTAAAAETSNVTFRGGQLGTVTAKITGGKAIVLVDATTTTKIFGDVTVTLINTTEGNVQYSAADTLTQSGKLVVNSKSAPSSVDQLVLSGKVSVGGLSALLGGMDDRVQILKASTIRGVTQLETGSGNDTVSIDGQAESVQLKGALNALLGDGNDTLVLNGKTGTADQSGIQIDGKVTVDAGAGNDIFTLTGVHAKSSLNALLGTGRNTLITDHIHVADVTKVTTAKSGLGDIVETGASVFAKAVTMQLGAGSVVIDGFGKKFHDLFNETLRITGLEKRPQVHLIFSEVPPTDSLFVVKADKTLTIAP